jgi:hypothetical protein
MQGSSIAGAFWSAARQFVTPRAAVRSAMVVISMVAVVLGSAISTARAAVEYDFIGGNFTFVTGAYTTADRVTGEITLPSPLAPSSNVFLGRTNSFSFSFSDGVNTISNSNANGPEFGAALTTNAAGQIVDSNVVFSTTRGSGPYTAVIGQTLGDESFGSDTLPGTFGQGYNFTAGTWSGPITVSPPPSAPSLYLTVNTDGPNSESKEPTSITAAITLADSPPSASALKLPVILPPTGITNLQDAAHALG